MNKNLSSLAVSILLINVSVAQTQQTTTVQKTVDTPTVVSENVEQTKSFTGTLSSVDPSLLTLSLSSQDSAGPVRYSYTDQTKFYDAEGHALTPEALESGSLATLTYVQAGTTLVVVKAIFSKAVEPIVTQAVVVEQSFPKVIAAPAVIVKPAPMPVVEETTTTTTTTTP